MEILTRVFFSGYLSHLQNTSNPSILQSPTSPYFPSTPVKPLYKDLYVCYAVHKTAGVFLSKLITYLDADGEDRVLVTEPESVLAATIRF